MLVESVCKNLQTLAMAVASQNAVLLEGPIGCGKTSLVEHLAAMTGRKKPPQLLKVQLGDQTDSKVIGISMLVNICVKILFLLRVYKNSYWSFMTDGTKL